MKNERSYTETLKKLQSAIVNPTKFLQTYWDERSNQILNKAEKVMLLLRVS